MTVYADGLEVDENIGEKGWELLAEDLQLHPGQLARVLTYKEALHGAMKKDVRAIWDAIWPSGFWRFTHNQEPNFPCENICKEEGDPAWGRLEHVLDVSMEGWRAENEEWLRWERERWRGMAGEDV